MADVVDKATRSRMMSGIRGKDTKPEILLRKGLFARGFRFRIHDKRLPGKPDMVFPKYRAVILAHGCFWHGHDCALFKWPSSRVVFWRGKISRNRELDELNHQKLEKQGWRVLTIYECALKGRDRIPLEKIIRRAASWLRSETDSLEIRGNRNKRERQTCRR